MNEYGIRYTKNTNSTVRFNTFQSDFPLRGKICINWSIFMDMHLRVQRLTLKNADQINRYLVISSDHESDMPRIYLENT